MAELIILIMMTISQCLEDGTSPDALAGLSAGAVAENAPFPLEEVAADVFIEPGPEDTAAELCNPEPDYRGPLRLRFTFKGVYLDPLTVSVLSIDLHGLALDSRGALELTGISYVFDIPAAELSAALAQESDIINPQVTLTAEDVILAGKYPTFLGDMPFEVIGDLVVENETQLVFRIDRSRMAGVKIPKFVNDMIAGEVNPVYDLLAFEERSRKDIELAKEKLGYELKVRVNSIDPEPGHIIVTGQA